MQLVSKVKKDIEKRQCDEFTKELLCSKMFFRCTNWLKRRCQSTYDVPRPLSSSKERMLSIFLFITELFWSLICFTSSSAKKKNLNAPNNCTVAQTKRNLTRKLGISVSQLKCAWHLRPEDKMIEITWALPTNGLKTLVNCHAIVIYCKKGLTNGEY